MNENQKPGLRVNSSIGEKQLDMDGSAVGAARIDPISKDRRLKTQTRIRSGKWQI
jgi:hypothetical protein